MNKIDTLNKKAPATDMSPAKRRSKRGNKDQKAEPCTILVPVDFSTNSLRALDFAGSLVQQFSADLVLVHVLDPIYTPGRFDSPRLRPLRREALQDAKANLAKLARVRRNGAPQPVKHHIIDGVAHAAIIDFAKKAKADWIVMGSKGRTGMKRFLAGSVAERVVRYATCPVLIVP